MQIIYAQRYSSMQRMREVVHRGDDWFVVPRNSAIDLLFGFSQGVLLGK